MSIPCKMRPAGLDSLPMGYTRLNFLECTRKQYINTGLKATGSLKIGLDVMATAWDDYVNYIFGSENKNRNVAFSMNYNNAYGTAGTYRYGTQWRYFNYGAHKLNQRYKYVFDENVVYRDGELFRFLDWGVMTKEEFTSARNITLFGSHHDNSALSITTGKRVFAFSIYDNAAGALLLSYVPVLDPDGTPCMYDTVSGKNFYNANTTASATPFIAGMTLGQALKLKDLPTKTATLDISLPEGYDSQEEVMESIRQAEAKGWTFNINTYTPA